MWRCPGNGRVSFSYFSKKKRVFAAMKIAKIACVARAARVACVPCVVCVACVVVSVLCSCFFQSSVFWVEFAVDRFV